VTLHTGDSGPDSAPGRLRRFADEYPELLTIGAYAVVAIAATITAYFTTFTTFAPYDDEGTLLIGLRAFVDGEPLYRDIWSVYGPFYYELFGGFFSLFGQEITNNAGRTIVLVVWVATSLFFGFAAHRFTRNLWLGLTGMIAAFGSLVVLANEPMHPHGLCVLLLGGFALLLASGPSRRPVWLGAGGGVLLAALLMTKVNLGVFAIAAVVVAAAFTAWPFAGRIPIRLLVGAAFLALPLAVLARDLDLAWTRELALLEILAMGAVLVAARPLRPTSTDRVLVRWLLGAGVGFAAALVVIIVALLATGPSLADAYDGIVRQAMGIRDLLIGQTPFPPVTVLTWAIVALAGAFLATRLMRSPQARPALWSALLRAAAGLVIWLGIAHIVLIGLNPSSANPVIVPMLVAWIAAIPPAGVVETPYKRFLRVLLPALAVAETLQIYPVPGSQLGIASVSFVAVGALCFADALTELRAIYSAPSFRLARLGEVTAVAGVALAGIFAVTTLVMPAAARIVDYRENEKLDLPGAGLMRLPEATTETYEQLAGLLHRHDCTTFIGWPGMGSVYLWADLPSPAPQPPNAWFHALDDDQQRQAVGQLRASSKPCVIRNEEQAGSYLRGEPAPNSPLVRYVLDDFKPVTDVGSYEFMLPKPSATDAGSTRP
jgi:hypothetical protein